MYIYLKFRERIDSIFHFIFLAVFSPPPKKWYGAGISAGYRRSRTNAIARGAGETPALKSSTEHWPRWR